MESWWEEGKGAKAAEREKRIYTAKFVFCFSGLDLVRRPSWLCPGCPTRCEHACPPG